MTPAKLSELLTEGYAKYLAQPPEVSVAVNSFTGNEIFCGRRSRWRRSQGTCPDRLQFGGDPAMSGGFKDTADRNRVILVRRGPDNKPLYMCLDIEKAMKGIDPNQDVYLQPYDVILVPRSDIANADLWVQQYIRASDRVRFRIRILLLYPWCFRPLDRLALPIQQAGITLRRFCSYETMQLRYGNESESSSSTA